MNEWASTIRRKTFRLGEVSKIESPESISYGEMDSDESREGISPGEVSRIESPEGIPHSEVVSDESREDIPRGEMSSGDFLMAVLATNGGKRQMDILKPTGCRLPAGRQG